jgi:hypothetical protein
MPFRQRHSPPPVGPASPKSGGRNHGGRSLAPLDLAALLRRVERKRRLLARAPGAQTSLPPDYYVRQTLASFRLDGLGVTEEEVREALGHGPERPLLLRSRQSQRLRNHAALLHHVENRLRAGHSLSTDDVVRWYTTISAGLSTTRLDLSATARVGEVVQRINSPQLRMRAALQEIASTHVRLMTDPLVPSFNGILARLLFRYHLGRCKLPAVVFDATLDARPPALDGAVGRLMQLLDESYDELLAKR